MWDFTVFSCLSFSGRLLELGHECLEAVSLQIVRLVNRSVAIIVLLFMEERYRCGLAASRAASWTVSGWRKNDFCLYFQDKVPVKSVCFASAQTLRLVINLVVMKCNQANVSY